MKKFPKMELLSFFSIILGIAGMALHSWLLSLMDNRGLLPYNHPGSILPFVLFALLVAVCFYVLRDIRTSGSRRHMFPRSPLSAVGSFLAAVGLGFSLLNQDSTGILSRLMYIVGLVSVFALCYVGYCRFKGKRPECVVYAIIVLFLVFRTLAHCQRWNSETQVSVYFFPLLAHLFLLLTVYFRAALEAHIKNCRQYMFFRQLTLFCCLVSMIGGDWVFYLAATVWMATDYCIPAFFGKYAT